jgi:DNA-binding GntR family transcriptional regulator
VVTTHWGLASVEQRSTSEQVLHELRAAIIDGRIGPRAPLREVALAEAFGTGRSAIREALSALSQEGLVVSERNRGTWVRELSRADVIDVYRARAAIEAAATEVALARDQLDLAPLQAALTTLQTAADCDGAPSQPLIAADIDFHRTLVALADSPRLTRAHEPLAAESQMLLNWHPGYLGSDYAGDHEQLLEALTHGGDTAVGAVHDHLRLTADLLVPVVERYTTKLTTGVDPLHIVDERPIAANEEPIHD